ncbi:SRPBCC family protein [Cellulosimicrobium composti]|uniref:SRPBCC family protein n=1 Tax=Cellulosimicrobium composti TaxID=2672572 RepID=UPI0004659971|nr:polyketide cyclase/dehydrase/lipid transport protein [Cellulosimicrobium cellulans J34]SMF18273.1 Polyketide cyclase / dehydrase and lipid transport [Cellulosimicrobium cellulans J1]
MRRRVTIEEHLDHPPSRVFPYLADPCRWPLFAPAVHSRRPLDDGPLRVGQRWAGVDRIGPFRVRFTDVLEAVDPGRRVVWYSTSPWSSRVEYVCTPDGPGTRVRADYDGDVSAWLRGLALLPTAVLARVLRRDFAGLRRVLEAEDRTAARSS